MPGRRSVLVAIGISHQSHQPSFVEIDDALRIVLRDTHGVRNTNDLQDAFKQPANVHNEWVAVRFFGYSLSRKKSGQAVALHATDISYVLPWFVVHTALGADDS